MGWFAAPPLANLLPGRHPTFSPTLLLVSLFFQGQQVVVEFEQGVVREVHHHDLVDLDSLIRLPGGAWTSCSGRW